MNKNIKSIIMTIGVFFVSFLSVSVYSETYSRQELKQIIKDTVDAADLDGLKIVRIVYAEGIQSYNLRVVDGDKEWVATGPLAELYSYNRKTGKIGVKIGSHYQQEAPVWEFFGEGRVIASSKIVTPVGERDIPWLEVTLKLNDLNYKRVYRVATDGGVKPIDVSNYRVRCNNVNRKCAYKTGASSGTGYRTLYLFFVEK